jgi:phosphoglycerate dehydrogenase-like enzyme
VETIAVTRSPSPERAEAAGLRWLGSLDELDRLLDAADVAVVCVPVGERTRGLVGARELALLGPDSYLVNVARGRVVDEEALYDALRERRIAGAALDVWWTYPAEGSVRSAPSRFPFHELDNVVMTPHVSGRSVGSARARTELVVAQLERLSTGTPLENVVAVGAAS